MSVLGILFHFSRAIIQAHNNAKVRNLMDVPPPRAHAEAGKEGPGATNGEVRSLRRRDRPSR